MTTAISMGKRVCVGGFLSLVLVSAGLCGYAQDRWGIEGQYLTLNGKPLFLSGANYIPSSGWYPMLENWNAAKVEADMAAMHQLGIKAVRFPQLWVLTQPEAGTLNQETLHHLNEVLTIAHRHGIAVQVEPLTGGICGAVFLPKWADGDVFNDARIVEGERRLVSGIAASVKDNPGLMGYDFGNEVDVLRSMMKLNPTPEETRRWMATIYGAFHEADPQHAVTNGLAFLHGNGTSFNIWDTADASDYMSVHNYDYFDETIKTDPWVGQRTLYDVNLGVAYAAMTGKPVLVQENGYSEAWIGDKDEVAKCLRVSMMSTWAQGAAGYFWWGSHDNDTNYRIPEKYPNLKYSEPSIGEGMMNQLEYSEGLLDTNNQPKPYGVEFARWAAVIDKLGTGWKNELPVVYLLHSDQPEKDDWPNRTTLTAFTLAKQTHVEVRMWPESKPVPSDAAGVVIAGFGLSAKGKAQVQAYLESGGTVYQSWASDFGGYAVTDKGATAAEPTFIVRTPLGGAPRRNRLLIAESDHIRVNAAVKLMDLSQADGPSSQLIMSLPGAEGATPRPVLLRTYIGKGTYYYLAINLEEALAPTYDPWQQDDSNRIYSILRPEGGVTIDSKYVELFVKTRGAERVFLLLNRSDRFQDVVLRTGKAIAIENYTSHAPLGEGREIPLRLMPGEVLVAAEVGGR